MPFPIEEKYSTEMEFCFSFYFPSGEEFWFQISLDSAFGIASGLIDEVEIASLA